MLPRYIAFTIGMNFGCRVAGSGFPAAGGFSPRGSLFTCSLAIVTMLQLSLLRLQPFSCPTVDHRDTAMRNAGLMNWPLGSSSWPSHPGPTLAG